MNIWIYCWYQLQSIFDQWDVVTVPDICQCHYNHYWMPASADRYDLLVVFLFEILRWGSLERVLNFFLNLPCHRYSHEFWYFLARAIYSLSFIFLGVNHLYLRAIFGMLSLLLIGWKFYFSSVMAALQKGSLQEESLFVKIYQYGNFTDHLYRYKYPFVSIK